MDAAPAEQGQLLRGVEAGRDRKVRRRLAQGAEQDVLQQQIGDVGEEQRDHDLADPQPEADSRAPGRSRPPRPAPRRPASAAAARALVRHRRRTTAVAAMAPSTSWPSSPMFQKPTRKAMAAPRPTRTSGIAVVTVWARPSGVRNTWTTSSSARRPAGTPAATSTRAASTSATRSEPRKLAAARERGTTARRSSAKRSSMAEHQGTDLRARRVRPALADDPAAAHDHDAVGQRQDLVQVLADQEDGGTRRRRCARARRGRRRRRRRRGRGSANGPRGRGPGSCSSRARTSFCALPPDSSRAARPGVAPAMPKAAMAEAAASRHPASRQQQAPEPAGRGRPTRPRLSATDRSPTRASRLRSDGT